MKTVDETTHLSTGITGMIGTIGSFLVSLMTHAEATLRIATLLLGLVIGVVTLLLQLRRLRHQRARDDQDEQQARDREDGD